METKMAVMKVGVMVAVKDSLSVLLLADGMVMRMVDD